jgi:hypothetical protein
VLFNGLFRGNKQRVHALLHAAEIAEIATGGVGGEMGGGMQYV